jgi:argininosuccinate lyase
MSFFWKGRFKEEPSDLLRYYYADTLRRPEFLEAIHTFDKAHLVLLAEQKLAPEDVTRALASALKAMEKEGVVEVRRKLWNVIHGGEEYLRGKCGEEVSGWIHLGRSSPCIRVVATRIALRDKLTQIMASINQVREVFIEQASNHVHTVMPGYSYIQHIEPTTYGFYLMSWVPPLERDFQRFLSAYRNTNISSVATGGAYGIQFDLDTQRADELLGFEGSPWNARDSIRHYDYAIECYMALALMHNNLGRLAMDFLVWASREFSMIELADRYSITSSISPQMRIPYVLEFVHAASGMITGRLMEALSINKTASDQLEPATMLPAEFWQCVDDSHRALESLSGALSTMKVKVDRMAQLANKHWSQSSTLIGWLVREKGLSFRTGHQILALFMQRVADQEISPEEVTVAMLEEAAREYTGKKLGISEEEFRRALDAKHCVEERKFRAGTAPVRVKDHIKETRKALVADAVTLDNLCKHIEESKHKLNQAFATLAPGSR